MANPGFSNDVSKYFSQTGIYSTRQTREWSIPAGGAQTVAFGDLGIEQRPTPITFRNALPTGTGNFQFINAGFYSLDVTVCIEPGVPDTAMSYFVGLQLVLDPTADPPVGLYIAQKSVEAPIALDVGNSDVFTHLHCCQYFSAGDQVGLIVTNNDQINGIIVPISADRGATLYVNQLQ